MTTGPFYVKHKAEFDAAWRIFIAHRKKHDEPFLWVHQRMQMYEDLRDETTSHLKALKQSLRAKPPELPTVVFIADSPAD